MWPKAQYAGPPDEQLMEVWALSLPLTIVSAFAFFCVVTRFDRGLSASLLIPILVIVFAFMSLLA
jgi:hypothetical protein